MVTTLEGKNLEDRGIQIPYCTIFLVLGALTCHILVLVGNLQAGAGISAIGDSTGGWSAVGIGMAKSFEGEIDEKMNFVTAKLTQTIATMLSVSNIIDKVLAIVGQASDVAAVGGFSLLATNQTQVPSQQAIDLAKDAVISQITTFVNKMFARITKTLKLFLDKAEPALKQVGVWIISFGDKLQAGIETFSVTIDKIQKIFDQLMEQLADSGGNSDFMRENTFNLFDTDFSGTISLKDLKKAAEVYGITALQGTKAEELHRKYDTNEDLELDKDTEYYHFVDDPSLPKVMAVVLRQYAKILAQVGTKVGRARMRDEVAKTVVGYTRLVSMKNRTKVAWICERLTNSSLPMAFTADVLKNLAVDTWDTSISTTLDVGQVVVEEMARLHPKYLSLTVQLLSHPEFFKSEGFDLHDQPKIVGVVNNWVVPALKAYGNGQSLLELEEHFFGKEVSNQSTPESLLQEENLHERFANRAHEHCEARGLELLQEERAQKAAEHEALMRSPTARLLFTELLGGTMATVKTDPAAKKVLKSGVPAVPTTLEFARFLYYNASRDAAIFQKASFKYSGQSSSPVDAVATQIKGMIKRVQGFLKMLESYATPEGIHRLRLKVENFAIAGEQEVLHVVLAQVNRTLDKVAGYVKKAAGRVQKEIEPYRPLINEAAKTALLEFPHDTLADDELAPSAAHHALIERLNSEFLLDPEHPGEMLIHDGALSEVDQIPDSVFGAFGMIKQMLEAFQSVLPTCIENLKLARTTVNSAQASIHSMFGTFKAQGPPIFYQASKAYDMLWSVYFVLLAFVTLGVLYYGFYTNNISGASDAEEPEGFCAKCTLICESCCFCFNGGFGGECCFWGVLVIAQIGVLLIFLISILLCILAGVKNFVASGCSQIYILGDEQVCTETLKLVQKFMMTFSVGDPAAFHIDQACGANTLMACQELGPKMATSASLTMLGGLLGAVLSFQMLVDVCVNHERAKCQSANLQDDSAK
jgi:hypothetical protein